MIKHLCKLFYNESSTYASHMLNKNKATLGCHSFSIISESNHSSLLINLNDDDKFGNSYWEKIRTLVIDFFVRRNISIIGTVFCTMSLYNWIYYKVRLIKIMSHLCMRSIQPYVWPFSRKSRPGKKKLKSMLNMFKV